MLSIYKLSPGDDFHAMDKGRDLFYAESKLLGTVRDSNYFAEFIENIVTNGTGVCFVAKDGAEVVGGCAAIEANDFSSGRKQAHELFWFVFPEYRGSAGIRLIKALESWCVEHGIERLTMVGLAGNVEVEQLYGRLGYAAGEVHYMKDFPVLPKASKVNLTIIDGFHPSPEQFRTAAISKSFDKVEHDGHSYPNMAMDDEGYDPSVEIGKVLGYEVEKVTGFFRTSLANDPTNIHVDACIGGASIAVVLYLTEQDKGFSGTAFWKHNITGLDELEVNKLTTEQAEWWNDQGSDKSNWEMEDFVRMKFNRLIIYPTDRFHSRYPFEGGWGDNASNSRLVWVGFYKPKKEIV